VAYIIPDLDDLPGKLVTEDDRRIVSEGILVNVKISTANPTITHFNFELIIATHGLFYLSQLHIANAAFVFD